MATLKEIKGRIGSVSNTLKITSAMKMVASAKLHRTQSATENLIAYEEALESISEPLRCSHTENNSPYITPHKESRRAIIVALSSDSSLCGSFNANIIKYLESYIRNQTKEFEEITIYPIGEKIAQSVAKSGHKCNLSRRNMAQNSSFESVAQLTEEFMELYRSESVDRVVLLYNHFQSVGRQTPTHEVLLPMSLKSEESEERSSVDIDYIIEPDIKSLNEKLIPHALRTKLYKTLLDSQVAEHAARMVAMQTATDNATELLEELRLSYNKGRQQAITAELADITQASSEN